MKNVNYELCKKCEKKMEQSGVFGITTEGMYKQKAEFGMDVGLPLLEEGCDIQRKSKEKELGSTIRLVKDKSEEYFATIQEGKVVSYRTLTTEELTAKDWKIVKLPA
ncbi:hypothetical protein [Bacillus cereus]|uniref:hypothetical protein n=1 Tax=Bacillus cereus TaxID=1396 RepID=UPI00032E25C7|nr:hypothetical protein [Bacillus cereus]EOO44573.1 hypothetical protein ICK_06348 [Bacillus cereus BAG1X2-2]